MIEDGAQLQHQILQSAINNIDERVVAVIRDKHTREVGKSDAGGTIAETLPIWKARAEINLGTDHPLIGADQLIATLQTRPQQAKVKQVNLVAPGHTCILFFDWLSNEFFGYILTRRRTAAEERARSERLAASGLPSQEQVRVA